MPRTLLRVLLTLPYLLFLPTQSRKYGFYLHFIVVITKAQTGIKPRNLPKITCNTGCQWPDQDLSPGSEVLVPSFYIVMDSEILPCVSSLKKEGGETRRQATLHIITYF